jgi:hypothetical protein
MKECSKTTLGGLNEVPQALSLSMAFVILSQQAQASFSHRRRQYHYRNIIEEQVVCSVAFS